jgi:hypothetical protein
MKPSAGRAEEKALADERNAVVFAVALRLRKHAKRGNRSTGMPVAFVFFAKLGMLSLELCPESRLFRV